ncbi:MAG: hypothetical protein KOO63_08030 [Bacteroidales bacterium]|nr:hypothetical protein [Candidatus Latescibacterota bacterium]
MDKEMRKRFWNDFLIPTQEVTEDVAYANPAEVARSLVRARNWYGTISEDVLEAVAHIETEAAALRSLEMHKNSLEQFIVARTMLTESLKALPTSVAKNQQTMSVFALSKATPEEAVDLSDIADKQREAEDSKSFWLTERAQAEIMRRALEKTTDWLVQYINWHKFELREQV